MPAAAVASLVVAYFPISSCSVAAPSHVTVAPDGGMRIEGEPFFPLGVYGYEGAGVTDELLPRLAEAGFNTFHSYAPAPDDAEDDGAAGRALFERCRQHGLRVLISLARPWDLLDLAANEQGLSSEQRKQRLAEIVNRWKDEPNLLGWQACEEALWNDYSAAGMAAGYDYVHSLDPNHPLWVNQAPRGSQDQPEEHGLIAAYLPACDATGVSIFPIPPEMMHSNLPGPDGWPIGGPVAVGAYTRLLRRIADSGQRPHSLWMVLQGCSWTDIAPDLPGMPYPTREELRFMILDAAGAGANGVFFWGLSPVTAESPFFTDLLAAAADVRPLLAALASPRPVQQPHCEPSTVTAFSASGGGEAFVVVLSRSGDPAKAHIRLPSELHSPKVLFGAQELQAQGSSVAMELPPFGSVGFESGT